jgi:hypothetical protein
MRYLKKLEHKFKRGLHSAHKFVSKGEGFLSILHTRSGHIVDSLHRNGFIDDADKASADKVLETGKRTVNFTGDLKGQMTQNSGNPGKGKMKTMPMPKNPENNQTE